MTKQRDKNVRKAVTEGDDKGNLSDDGIRDFLGTSIQLDYKTYKQAYPNMAFVLPVDRGSEMLRYERAGFEYVPLNQKDEVRGRQDSVVRWECGSAKDGSPEYQYLMMIDKEQYERIKGAKNNQALEPMRRMKAQSDAGQANSVGDVSGSVATYAPQLSTGGSGMDIGQSIENF